MRDAVIVEAVRTPVGIGKPGKGALSEMHPVDVSAAILREVINRAGIESHLVEDVYWGCVGQVGEQSTNIGRNAALAAGFPQSVTGTTIDRQCGSSQQAVAFAAASVISGNSDIVIAGGVESMSRVPMFSNMAGGDGPFSPEMLKHYPHLVPQGLSAEMIAEQWALSREQLDEIAAISQQRAAKASSDGIFDSETLPIAGVSVDQGIRPGTTTETLSVLKPAFNPKGVVTAGNASQISDGSAALLVMTSERAKELGLQPIVRVHTNAMAGVDPVIMLTGPIPATEKVLTKSGLSLGDIGVFEVNEAFACVVGAWLKDTGADHGITNPNGGAIALGHPLGASGARIMTTLVHHMRRNNIRYGLQTMCEGGGMANATILELL
ncbi:MAG: thiolase family protein [Candidatus Nanopelagicales bacterium]|jgi:acetyl-CoA acyltransferase|nr:thiolase family protein [Actinomycetota bacterium]NCG03024.1 acetyl-CoA C-acyltransferase [Actinomycetales bacterium]MBT5500963.1 thiolase family protein [Actinomycetota bacterium]MBT5806828.1 thiolase family protein [Actinomycetota bacterium]MDA9890621.1 thiolase family protein [Actinomycetota bacterium]